MRDAVIVSACRTAIGRSKKGSLKDTRPENMMAAVISETVNRAPGLAKNQIDDVIVGCAMPEGEQGMNIARLCSVQAGLPYEVPAMTINRFCSSGLQAIVIAVEKIMVGWADVVIAGGVESMSMVPMGGNKMVANQDLFDAYPEVYTPMGLTAELVAQRFNVGREEQDAFAVESHAKAIEAIKAGRFKDEIVPLPTKVWRDSGNGLGAWEEIVFDTDECPRPGTTVAALSKLRSAFTPKGSVTAGNASPLNDGAAAVCVMSREKAQALGLKPLGVLRCHTVAGVDPEIMGIGPTAAVPKVLDLAGMTLDQIDLIEINEAFASQSVYCVNKLELPKEKTNVNGGAIALGHPLGCTGAKLTVQLLYEMARRDNRFGIVTMCIGGGMGAAAIFEREA